MTHIRAIADVPTSDEPTGTALDNPFASGGRPLIEVKILSMDMIGVADPDGTIRNPPSTAVSSNSLLEDVAIIIGVPFALILVGVGITMAVYGQLNARQEDASSTAAPLEAEMVMVAELVEPDDVKGGS